MTGKEYRERDFELLGAIQEYHASNAEKEMQNAMNNKQIMELEKQRHELYGEYLNTNEK